MSTARELNTFLLDTAKSQGWLDDGQYDAARQALEGDPDLSMEDYLRSQGGLTEEHIGWLKEQAPPGDGDEPGPSPVQVAEPEAGGGMDPAAAREAGLLPPDTAIEISLGRDGALRHLNDYLNLGRYYGASDVHLGVTAPPIMRRFGSLQPLWPNAPAFVAPQTERLLTEILSDAQKKQLHERGDADFCYAAAGLGRFRCSIIRQRLGLDGVFRIINSQVRTMDELGLPERLKGLTQYHNGLVLITGPGGCGKSTTMAAFIDEVNGTRHDHIVTVEDPIEYVFHPKNCHITQREIHSHTESFSRALRAALREDPDVIMVGEMRDLETVSLAIRASETGHLVFATLHTRNAARTLDRILDVFPIEQQPQIRTMVAGSLRGVVSQQLIPRKDGAGRVLALEVLINTRAVESLIRDGKTFQIPSAMQTGKKVGCRPMDDSLLELLRNGTISPQDAYERAENKLLFKPYVKA